MTPREIAAPFKLFFDLKASTNALEIERLTAGDFANVRTKAKIMGDLDDADALTNHLEKEVLAKGDEGGPSRAIGFGR